MTDLDPDGALAALLVDPAPDPRFVDRVAALVRAEQLYAAERRRAWTRLGLDAAGALAVAAAAGMVASAPDLGWTLAVIVAGLPLAFMTIFSVDPDKQRVLQ